MARDKGGFFTDVVSIKKEIKAIDIKDNSNINNDSDIDSNINIDSNVDINSKEELEAMLTKDKPKKKKSVLLYIDEDIDKELSRIGRRVGKTKGGKSAVVNEILTQFLRE